MSSNSPLWDFDKSLKLSKSEFNLHWLNVTSCMLFNRPFQTPAIYQKLCQIAEHTKINKKSFLSSKKVQPVGEIKKSTVNHSTGPYVRAERNQGVDGAGRGAGVGDPEKSLDAEPSGGAGLRRPLP